jgi:hypothetical protein
VIGFAEHDVVGTSFAGEHGIMTIMQPAGAGDAVGLERAKRVGKRRHAGEMSAIGAGARHDLSMAVEEKRGVAALDGGRHCFSTVDQRALVARFEAQQHGSNIASRDGVANLSRQSRGIGEARRDEAKPGIATSPPARRG